ncbi:MAG TPA: sortase [Candidatus Aphodocola excrementigallinarum]|uniref:Sortase n=1 Tax=Candidatus Aphodocola excrementigallinarum TaxID=2840670 RepID=A0A9D1LH96_9FIRM|nr:sortase [Candidatus Aphodocola excrementigallinarum]
MKKMFSKINKEKVFNVLILLVVIGLYIAVALLIYTNFRERKRQEISNGIIDKIDDVIEENENNPVTEATVSYGGFKYTVLGKLRIRKINIYEPILKENTASAYNTALVKMSGPDLNENGNVAIGGHNFMRGNYFIKINRLRKNDVVTVTDLTGRSVDYYVYEYGIRSADDASYLAQPDNENEKIVTLVTCTKGGKERYVVKARAK